MQHSNSTKDSALSMLKDGMTQRKVSERMGIPRRTLQDWKKASMKSTRVSALTQLKGGMTTGEVSERMGIPVRTIQDWKKASMKSENWHQLVNDQDAQFAGRTALRKELWFHGDISCDEAVARLSVHGTPGSFLVRYSHNLYIFSFIEKGREKVRHIKVPFDYGRIDPGPKNTGDQILLEEFPDLKNEYEVIKKIFSLNCPFFTLPVSRPELNLPDIRKVTLEKRSSERYVCKVCNFKANEGWKNVKHSQQHRLYWCKRCQGFMTLASRYNHSLSCEPDKPFYQCDNCKTKIRKPTEFKRHQRLCLQKKFKCSSCEKVFLTKEKLDVHTTEIHQLSRISCNICGNTYSSRKTLNYHEQTIHDIGTKERNFSFFCPKCEFKTFTTILLERHVRHTHDPTTKTPKYQCIESPFGSNRRTEYVKHLEKHKEDEKVDIFIGI